jgi:hypothetical protein
MKQNDMERFKTKSGKESCQKNEIKKKILILAQKHA